MNGLKTLGAVLAGGESRRFGSPKVAAMLAGRTLLRWVVEAQRAALGEDVVIVGTLPSAPPATLPRIRILPDLLPGRGPAGGIASALAWASDHGFDGIWVTPADAPFLDPKLFRLLLEQAGRDRVVIPTSGGPLGFEPLFGWYGVGFASAFTDAIAGGAAPVHEIVGSLSDTCFVDPSSVGADRLFWNINTPRDMHAAERLLEGKQDEG